MFQEGGPLSLPRVTACTRACETLRPCVLEDFEQLGPEAAIREQLLQLLQWAGVQA